MWATPHASGKKLAAMAEIHSASSG